MNYILKANTISRHPQKEGTPFFGGYENNVQHFDYYPHIHKSTVIFYKNQTTVRDCSKESLGKKKLERKFNFNYLSIRSQWGWYLLKRTNDFQANLPN